MKRTLDAIIKGIKKKFWKSVSGVQLKIEFVLLTYFAHIGKLIEFNIDELKKFERGLTKRSEKGSLIISRWSKAELKTIAIESVGLVQAVSKRV